MREGTRPGGVEGTGRAREGVVPRSARLSAPLGGKAKVWRARRSGGRWKREQPCSRSPHRPARSLPRRLSPTMPAEGELPSAAAAEPEPGEPQYLRQVRHILQHGHRKEDRTGTGTISVFGMHARYSLRGRHRRAPAPAPYPCPPRLPTLARRGSIRRRPAPGGGTPSPSPGLPRRRPPRARPPPLRAAARARCGVCGGVWGRPVWSLSLPSSPRQPGLLLSLGQQPGLARPRGCHRVKNRVRF